MTEKQRFVLFRLQQGLQLWRYRAPGKSVWGLERPIVRDLQDEENYPVASRTASSLLARKWIVADGTYSSLAQRYYYRITDAGIKAERR